MPNFVFNIVSAGSVTMEGIQFSLDNQIATGTDLAGTAWAVIPSTSNITAITPAQTTDGGGLVISGNWIAHSIAPGLKMRCCAPERSSSELREST